MHPRYTVHCNNVSSSRISPDLSSYSPNTLSVFAFLSLVLPPSLSLFLSLARRSDDKASTKKHGARFAAIINALLTIGYPVPDCIGCIAQLQRVARHTRYDTVVIPRDNSRAITPRKRSAAFGARSLARSADPISDDVTGNDVNIVSVARVRRANSERFGGI